MSHQMRRNIYSLGRYDNEVKVFLAKEARDANCKQSECILIRT